MSNFSFYGLNRTYCDTCEDMRKVIQAGSHASWKTTKELLTSLVEELQVYGSRMEARLTDIDDLDSLHAKIKAAKQEMRELDKKLEKKK